MNLKYINNEVKYIQSSASVGVSDTNQTHRILYSPVKVVAQWTLQRRPTSVEETPVMDTKLIYSC